MSLNEDKIADRIIRQLDGIGIDSKVDGDLSHTANLVKLIVSEVINAIRADAVVYTRVQTTGSANAHTGTGTGNIS